MIIMEFGSHKISDNLCKRDHKKMFEFIQLLIENYKITYKINKTNVSLERLIQFTGFNNNVQGYVYI